MILNLQEINMEDESFPPKNYANPIISFLFIGFKVMEKGFKSNSSPPPLNTPPNLENNYILFLQKPKKFESFL